MLGHLQGYFLSHIEAGTELSIILKHIPYQNVAAWFYMLGCALLALWALCSRRTRRACALMLPPAAALTAAGFTLRLTIFGEVIRTIKLLPLAVMLALCLMQILIRPFRPPKPAPDAPTYPRHASCPNNDAVHETRPEP